MERKVHGDLMKASTASAAASSAEPG